MFDRPCHDSRPCFGKDDVLAKAYKDLPRCRILTETYNDGKCPFCKPEQLVTDGREYPIAEKYLPTYCYKVPRHERVRCRQSKKKR